MQSKPVDLRTSAQNSPALGGLAASPAQSARGSTKSLGRWRPAIAAALEEIQRRFVSSGTSAHLNPSGASLDALLRQSGLSSFADRAASKPLTAPIAISSTAPQKMKLSTQTMFLPAQLSIARDKSNVQAITLSYVAYLASVAGAGFGGNLSGNYCYVYRYGNLYTTQTPDYVREGVYSCPADSTLSGNTCTCNAGTEENAGTCGAPDYLKQLNDSGGAVVGDGPCGIDKCWQSPGGGLKVRGSGATCWKSKETGKNMFEVYGPFVANGGPCTETPETGGGSTPTAPETPSPATCTGYWGSVNGEDRCIPKSGSTGTGSATPEDKQTTTTDGTGTTTTGTEGTTTCFDGTCTTTKTTTTTPPGGTPLTVTTTSSQPKVTYCQENPAAAACKAPSECDTNPDSLACLKLGTPDNGVQLTKLDAGFSAITPVSFAAGVGCPADLTFNVNAKPYAISYAPMCNAASTYGAPVVLILGVALAAFIFSGGFKA